VAQRLTRFAQNELSARTCGFESHPPHQPFFLELPECHAEPSIDVECRPNNWFSISVAKRQSVAILDEFIGRKS
jgi:hypothetical protein